MPNEALKKIGQGLFLGESGYSRGGVCYYMCNFIESAKGPWDKPGTLANAKTKAKAFAQGAAMMTYAKAQNLKAKGGKAHGVAQNAPGTAVAGALAAKRMFRLSLWIGAAADNPADATDVNHEAIAVTGDGDEIVYFEPNFGFFAPSESGASNRVALERFINEQYTAIGWHAENFLYLNLRAINSNMPKSA